MVVSPFPRSHFVKSDRSMFACLYAASVLGVLVSGWAIVESFRCDGFSKRVRSARYVRQRDSRLQV